MSILYRFGAFCSDGTISRILVSGTAGTTPAALLAPWPTCHSGEGTLTVVQVSLVAGKEAREASTCGGGGKH